MFSVIYVRTECSVRTGKTVVHNKEWSKLQCFRQHLLALCGVHSAYWAGCVFGTSRAAVKPDKATLLIAHTLQVHNALDLELSFGCCTFRKPYSQLFHDPQIQVSSYRI